MEFLVSSVKVKMTRVVDFFYECLKNPIRYILTVINWKTVCYY